MSDPDARPLLVVIDDDPWDSFNQLATLARQRGCRTLRVTTRATLVSRWPNRLLYDRGVILRSWQDLVSLDDLAGDHRIVDLQCPERLLPIASRLAASSTSVTTQARSRVEVRTAFADKLDAGRRLRGAGIPVPDQLPAGQTTVQDAVLTLGLPLAVKPRLGDAGRGVVVAHALAELERAVATSSVEELLFEQHVEGASLSFCGVLADGEVLQDAALVRTSVDPLRLGLRGTFRTIDDERLFELGRAVAKAIGSSVLIDLDVVRDGHGRDVVVDVNLRAWHSMGLLRSAGVDFVDGYLYAIGVRPTPPSERRPRSGVDVRPSLRPPPLPGTGRRALTDMAWLLGASWRRLRTFGPRYLLADLLALVSRRLQRPKLRAPVDAVLSRSKESVGWARR